MAEKHLTSSCSKASANSPNLKRANRSKRIKLLSSKDSPSQKKLKCNLTGNKKNSNKLLSTRTISSTSVTNEEEIFKSENADDEDLWLEALEKGELDDNGELPKTRDPTLMTTRQRALMDRSSTTLIEEIPITREETEEERRKRLERNQRRKLQAVKKAKETQKQTIRKLVEIPKNTKEKQKSTSQSVSNKPPVAMIKYINNATSCTISYPIGFDYPLKPIKSLPACPQRTCQVCGDARKYVCSRTNVPLCSFNCYKKNLKTGIA